MAQRKTLSEVQVAVLRWIGDGCPDDGVADLVSARISAAALRNRGLVRTSGHGRKWQAAITPAGIEYLERVDGPNPPLPRQPNVPVTQQLVDDVRAAGGSLRVPRKRWDDKDRVDYERRARLAETYGRVPSGNRLVVKSASPEELVVELVAVGASAGDSADAVPALAPLPVPSRLSKYHALAREFRDRTSLHEVSRKALPRVLRIVHALAVEAERRGYEVACVRVREDTYGRSEWKPAQDGQLVFTINGHQFKVRIWEKGAGRRGPYERQLQRWKRDREQPFHLMQFVDRPKSYDSGATGELNIEVVGSSHGRQASWGDRSRWRIEDRLPNLLHELAIEAVEAEERRLAREREEAELQRKWEAAMEHAKRRLVEDHRLEVLRSQLRAWEEAEAIRHYCDAVEARHGADRIAADSDAAAWLKLAREYADRAQRLPRMPPAPEITHERLKPYLGHWSPYGPQRW